MASYLQEYREKFPEYDDLDDAQLVQALHKTKMPDMPFEKFAAEVMAERSLGAAFVGAAKAAPEIFNRQAKTIVETMGSQNEYLSSLSRRRNAAFDLFQRGEINYDEYRKQYEDLRYAAFQDAHEVQTKRAEATKQARKEEQEALPFTIPGTGANVISSATASGIAMFPAIGTTLLTRSPNLGAAVFGAPIFTDQYSKSLAMGRGRGEAIQDATVMTISELVWERFQLGLLTKTGKGAVNRILRVASAGGVEAGQEALTGVIQKAYEEGIITREMSVQEAIAEIFEDSEEGQQARLELRDQTLAGLVMGGTMQGSVEVADAALRRLGILKDDESIGDVGADDGPQDAPQGPDGPSPLEGTVETAAERAARERRERGLSDESVRAPAEQAPEYRPTMLEPPDDGGTGGGAGGGTPASPSPDDALLNERERMRDEGKTNGQYRAQFDALGAAVGTSWSPYEAMDLAQAAIDAGRLDIAEGIARRARAEANKSAQRQPGVSRESERYEAIKQDLADRADEAARIADEIEALVSGEAPAPVEPTGGTDERFTNPGPDNYTDQQRALIEGPAGNDPVFAKVLHGSPNVFNEVSMAMMGDGAGQQRFGAGFYATEDPAQAEMFRVRPPSALQFDEVAMNLGRARFAVRDAEAAGDPVALREAIARAAEAQRAYMEAIENQRPGPIYELEIPADFKQRALRLTERFSESPRAVQDAIRNIFAKYAPEYTPDPNDLGIIVVQDIRNTALSTPERRKRAAEAVGVPADTDPDVIVRELMNKAGIAGGRVQVGFPSPSTSQRGREEIVLYNTNQIDRLIQKNSLDDPGNEVFNRSREIAQGRDDGEMDTLAGGPRTLPMADRGRVLIGKNSKAIEAAKRYMERAGMEYNPPADYVSVNKELARAFANEFELMEHTPDDPEVAAAYEAMAEETIAQYEAILETGLQIEFIEGDESPYPTTNEALADVRENNHLWVFSTRDGFGSDDAFFDPSQNPLLRETKYEISGQKALVNDLFRVVHDYFGHIKHGVGFRATGEENAWQSHASMYSPLARRAMTVETRGQNSWVNFGPHAEFNRTASGADTIYADQKIGLLPIWVSERNRVTRQKPGYVRVDGRDGSVRNVPAIDADGNVTLTHYSKQPGLTRLDPKFAGTGLDGRNLRRRFNGPRLRPRVFFGIAPSNGDWYQKESGLGGVEYEVKFPADLIYDRDGDPENLRDQIPDGLTPIQQVEAYEELIRNAGYSGYWRNNPQLGMVAVSWDAIPVPPSQVAGVSRAVQRDPDIRRQQTIAAIRAGLRGLSIKDVAREVFGDASSASYQKARNAMQNAGIYRDNEPNVTRAVVEGYLNGESLEQLADHVRRLHPNAIDPELVVRQELRRADVVGVRRGRAATSQDRPAGAVASDRFFQRRIAQQRKADDLRQAIRGALNSFDAGVRSLVRVVNSFSDLPLRLRNQLDSYGTQGVYDPDPLQPGIYLIADMIGSDIEAMEILMHETVGHYGLRQVLGPDYARVMDQMFQTYPDLVKAAAKRNGLNIAHARERRAASEEAFAYMAQEMLRDGKLKKNELTLLQKLVDAIRAFLRRVFKGEDTLTDNQIYKIIEKAFNYVQSPSGFALEQQQGVMRHVSPPAFYSDLFNFLNDPSLPDEASQKDWANRLKAAINKGLIKPTEIADTMLDVDALAKGELTAGDLFFESDPERRSYLRSISQELDDAETAALDALAAYNRRFTVFIEEAELDALEDASRRAEEARVEALGKAAQIPLPRLTREQLMDMVIRSAPRIEIDTRVGEGADTYSEVRNEIDLFLQDGLEVESEHDWTQSRDLEDAYIDDNTLRDAARETARHWRDSEVEESELEILESRAADYFVRGKDPEEVRDIVANMVTDMVGDGERAQKLLDAYDSAWKEKLEEMQEEALSAEYESLATSGELYAQGTFTYEGLHYHVTKEPGGSAYDIYAPHHDPQDQAGVRQIGREPHPMSGGNYSFPDAPAVISAIADDLLDHGVVETGGYGQSASWERYTVPGEKENYGETLLIWENNPGWAFTEYSHFDAENQIVHLRYSERQNADGQTVFFIEELQSDWHQEIQKTRKRLTAAERKLEEEQKHYDQMHKEFDSGVRAAVEANDLNLMPTVWTMIDGVHDLRERVGLMEILREAQRYLNASKNALNEDLVKVVGRLDDLVNGGGDTSALYGPGTEVGMRRSVINGFLERVKKATERARINGRLKPNYDAALGDYLTSLRAERRAMDTIAMHKSRVDSLRKEADTHDDVPFSNTYAALAFKWALHEAHNRGIKHVAMSTGSIHAVRWGGAQYAKANTDVSFVDNGDDTISVVTTYSEMKSRPVEEIRKLYAGNPAVIKWLDDPNLPQTLTLNTNDYGMPILTGMMRPETVAGSQTFYDSVAPNQINKFLKKFKTRMSIGKLKGYGEGEGQMVPYTSESSPVDSPDAMLAHMVTIDGKLKEHLDAVGGFPMYAKRANNYGPQNDGDPFVYVNQGNIFNAFINAWQDKYEVLLRGLKQAYGHYSKVPDRVNAWMKENLMHGRVRARLDAYDKQYVKPLVQAIADSRWSWGDVEAYLYARHAKEANRVISQRNPDSPEVNSGMSDAEADNIMETLRKSEGFSELEAIGKMIDEMVEVTRNLLVDTGLKSKEEVDGWRQMYEHYVPLKGFAGDANDGPLAMEGKYGILPPKGRGFSSPLKMVKRRLGRVDSRATNIIAYIVAGHQQAVVVSEKARVARALVDFIREHPSNLYEIVEDVEYERRFNERTGLVETKIKSQFPLADNYIPVAYDGETVLLRFDTENPASARLLDALQNMSAQRLGAFLRMTLMLNRYYSAINTGWNPEFFITNYFRDIQTAFVTASTEEIKGIARKIALDSRKGIAGAMSELFGNGKHKWAAIYRDFKDAGGQTGYVDSYRSMTDLEKSLRRGLNETRRARIANRARLIRDHIENFNIAIENGVRIAAFYHGMQNGMSRDKAAEFAKNLTVNFNRRGANTLTANSLYLFFNAAVQGTTNVAKVAASPRGRKLIAGIGLAGAVMSIMARLIGGEDDDGSYIYDRIPWHIKERNYIFVLPESMRDSDEIEDAYIAIPMPYGYNFFAAAGQKAGDLIFRNLWGNPTEPKSRIGNSAALQDVWELAMSFMGAFNPMGAEGSVGQTISPTFFDPFVQIMENKSWHGGPLMPSVDPFDQAPPPDAYRAFKSTPDVYKIISEKLNKWSGGNIVEPGIIDVSPEVFELVADTLGGGVSSFLGKSYTSIKGAIVGDEIEARSIPLKSKVFKATGAREIQDAYFTQVVRFEYAKKIEKAADELFNAGDPKGELGVLEYRLETAYSVEQELMQDYENAQKDLRKKRAERDAYYLSGEQDIVEEIDKEMLDIMREFNKTYNDVVKEQAGVDIRPTTMFNGQGPDVLKHMRMNGYDQSAELVASLIAQPGAR